MAASEIEMPETFGCTFQWGIINVGHFWWLDKGEAIKSPTFIADALEKTKWTLWFNPMEGKDEREVGIYLHREKDCSGPNTIEVYYKFAFLGKDGSILRENTVEMKNKFWKNDNGGWTLEERERIFCTERESFLPEDTLNIKCTIWRKNCKSSGTNIFAASFIKVKRRSFEWRIDKPSTLKSCMGNKFKDYLIGFDMVLSESFDRLDIDIISFDSSIKYISCNTSIIDSEGRKENCDIKKYFSDDLRNGPLSFMLTLPKMLRENKSRYFPNDVLSLDFEFVMTTIEHSDCTESSIQLENEVVGQEESQNAIVLKDDLKSIYLDGTFSDIELRTSTKIFSAHKFILVTRSPVFRTMFRNDMEDKTCGHVDMTDFEEDTIHRMLLFIYTDSLEDLQYESASKLYKIADKYQILPLKGRCSSFLKEKLCPTNACEVLDLAVTCHDDDLKNAVQDYILGERKQIFCSQEWKDFMSTHLKLAADIMYKKLAKSKRHRP